VREQTVSNSCLQNDILVKKLDLTPEVSPNYVSEHANMLKVAPLLEDDLHFS
jgi:hypothetical protein